MTGCSEKLSIGILGCSDIARRKFIPALGKTKSAVLQAIASSDPVKSAVAHPDLPVEPVSYEALLADPGIRLLYISLPNHLHEEFALRACRVANMSSVKSPSAFRQLQSSECLPVPRREGFCSSKISCTFIIPSMLQ